MLWRPSPTADTCAPPASAGPKQPARPHVAGAWSYTADMWITGREVEQQLAITYGEREKLRATGLLVPVGTAGRSFLYEADTVASLAQRPDAAVPTPAIVVRLGAPQSTEDEYPRVRQSRGWCNSWDDVTKRDAARMWWPVAKPDRLHDGTLIAVVAHVVVGAWRIDSHEYNESGRVAFSVDEPPGITDAHGRPFSDTVLRLGRGPLLKVW